MSSASPTAPSERQRAATPSSSASARANVSASRIMPSNWLPTTPPSAVAAAAPPRAARPPIASSRERGTWPRLRASSRRLGVALLGALLSRSLLGHGSVLRAQRAPAAAQRLASIEFDEARAGTRRQAEQHDHQTRTISVDRKADREQVQRRRRAAHRRRTRGSTTSSAVTPGSATRSAPANSCAAPRGNASSRPPRPSTARADRQRCEACRPAARISARWPSSARNVSVTSIM